jgi:hypothetical protein
MKGFELKKQERQSYSSHFLDALQDVLYATMTALYLKYIKHKLTFSEVYTRIFDELGVQIIDFKDLKNIMRLESEFFKKLKSKYLKAFIPPDLQNLACEVRILYLFFLLFLPKKIARFWAALYGTTQPAFKSWPMKYGILTLADALFIRKKIGIFTRENLEKALQKLTAEGILRGEKITLDELLSNFEITPPDEVSNYILGIYEKEKIKEEKSKIKRKKLLY